MNTMGARNRWISVRLYRLSICVFFALLALPHSSTASEPASYASSSIQNASVDTLVLWIGPSLAANCTVEEGTPSCPFLSFEKAVETATNQTCPILNQEIDDSDDDCYEKTEIHVMAGDYVVSTVQIKDRSISFYGNDAVLMGLPSVVHSMFYFSAAGHIELSGFTVTYLSRELLTSFATSVDVSDVSIVHVSLDERDIFELYSASTLTMHNVLFANVEAESLVTADTLSLTFSNVAVINTTGDIYLDADSGTLSNYHSLNSSTSLEISNVCNVTFSNITIENQAPCRHTDFVGVDGGSDCYAISVQLSAPDSVKPVSFDGLTIINTEDALYVLQIFELEMRNVLIHNCSSSEALIYGLFLSDLVFEDWTIRDCNEASIIFDNVMTASVDRVRFEDNGFIFWRVTAGTILTKNFFALNTELEVNVATLDFCLFDSIFFGSSKTTSSINFESDCTFLDSYFENVSFEANSLQTSAIVRNSTFVATTASLYDVILSNSFLTRPAWKLHGSAVLDNCTFVDGQRLIDSGLFVASSTQISNSVFSYEGPPPLLPAPPFVQATGTATVLKITNVTITGLHTTAFGFDSGSGEISNVIFDSLTSDYGAAVYCDACKLKMSDSIMTNNIAITDGGAIYATGECQLSLDHVIAQECSCDSGSGGVIDMGGSGALDISHSFFYRNRALTAGAIKVHGLSILTAVNVTVTECESLSTGGAFVLSDYARAYLEDCDISHNLALSYGGAFSSGSYAHLGLRNTSLSSNVTPMVGGALYFQDFSSCNISDTFIINNYAGSSVGAVAFAVSSSGYIRSSVIRDNRAESSAGGVGCYQFSNVTLEDVFITNNTAESGGAIWTEDDASVFASDLVLANNVVASVGGAVVASGGSQFHCTRCAIESNTADGVGGAIFTDKVAVTSFTSTTFFDNYGDSGGGAAIMSNSGSQFQTCTFRRNSADRKGGAILLAGTSNRALTELSNCSFLNNTSFQGGGIYATVVSDVQLVDAIFLGNHAEYRGGALLFDQHTRVKIVNSTISANFAHESGGGIVFSRHVSGRVTDSNINENHADIGRGGGIFMEEARVELENCTIARNSAAWAGGVHLALFGRLSRRRSLFVDCCITANVASDVGGGIAIEGGHFVGNSTHESRKGETWYNVDGTPTRSGTFADELEDDDDYDVMEALPLSWTFQNCNVSDNIAKSGGGIFVSTQHTDRVLFGPAVAILRNVALEFGGGVFIQTGFNTTWLYGATFDQNTAVYGGYNVAWFFASDTSGSFCSDCTYGETVDNTLGYNDKRGFATMPAAVHLIRDCPVGLTLDGGIFQVEASVVDSFGTLVSGELLNVGEFAVQSQVTSAQNCFFSSNETSIVENVRRDSGEAVFSLSLVANNGTYCSMSFSSMDIQLSSAQCSIYMSGCSNGNEVEHLVTYDTCIPAEKDSSVINYTKYLLCALFGLLVLLLVALIGWLVWLYKRRQKQKLKAYYANLEIPDKLSAEVSLLGLLNDPGIEVIEWEDLLILERIGVGATGIVSRGEWTKPPKPGAESERREIMSVAVKELLLPVSELNPGALQEFIYEIQLMSALKHPTVVEFLGVAYDVDKQTLFLITELMGQGSLADVCAKKGANLEERLRIKMATDAAEGMAYLHSQNVIHRDLKLQNLLVDDQWVCKLSDFGISTVKSTTRTMTCIGTPLYMAPEVLRQSRYSEKADVYSFGIVVVELVTGSAAYADKKDMNDAQLLYQIVTEGLRPNLSELPSALQELVVDCLSEEPDMRPSFPEIVVRLKRIFNKLTTVN